jgi:hypothetical protein
VTREERIDAVADQIDEMLVQLSVLRNLRDDKPAMAMISAEKICLALRVAHVNSRSLLSSYTAAAEKRGAAR